MRDPISTQINHYSQPVSSHPQNVCTGQRSAPSGEEGWDPQVVLGGSSFSFCPTTTSSKHFSFPSRDRDHRRRQASRPRALCPRRILTVWSPTPVPTKIVGNHTQSLSTSETIWRHTLGEVLLCINSGYPWIVSADTGGSTMGSFAFQVEQKLFQILLPQALCEYPSSSFMQHWTLTVHKHYLLNNILFFLPTTLRTPTTCYIMWWTKKSSKYAIITLWSKNQLFCIGESFQLTLP